MIFSLPRLPSDTTTSTDRQGHQIMNIVVSGGGKIHLLPGDVVSRIAAGEVVERPAAVVKELIENSLDAGSASITVEVKEGGLGLIRVTDDGEGMSRSDAPRAFARHSTSKLRSDRELTSICTMGFRGEALPSIASVSKVRLRTSIKNEPVGTQLLVTAGEVTKLADVAAAPGTQIEVTDLFFNTPVRRKFLKSPTTEFSHISQVVQHAGLAWPQTQFRLLNNGHEALNYPAVSSDRDRILQVYRSSFLERSIRIQGEHPLVNLSGYAIDAVHARASKTPQDLFVNRRSVRNATVYHAIADGYGSFLAKGRHPVFVLFLNVAPDRVDVNVHPAKREIRFVDQEIVHQAVRQAVHHALGEGQRKTQISGRLPGEDSRESPSLSPVSLQAEALPVIGKTRQGFAVSSMAEQETSLPESGIQTSCVQEERPSYLSEREADVVPLGQLDRTFLVAQVGAELQVVDQHTAHERVLFERLWRSWQTREVASQPLLLPEPVELPPDKVMLLQRHLGDLEKLGVHVEPFGSGTLLIRALPAVLGRFEAGAFVQDLMEDLSQWEAASSLEARVRPVMASLACHGAVRAGRAMALPEIKQLIEDWVSEGLIMTCPHGRRVALRLPTDELARIFGRA